MTSWAYEISGEAVRLAEAVLSLSGGELVRMAKAMALSIEFLPSPGATVLIHDLWTDGERLPAAERMRSLFPGVEARAGSVPGTWFIDAMAGGVFFTSNTRNPNDARGKIRNGAEEIPVR